MPSASDTTVIVCSRNRADMLADALAAISTTSPPEIEVLVVDSASDTDDTRQVALERNAHYARSGKGLSIARNVGITTAARPIVVFTDDDCLPSPGWIEHLLSGFDSESVAAVTGRMLDHTVSADTPYARPRRYDAPLSGLDAGHGAVMAFRREVLLRLGGFDDVMGAGQRLAGAEDLDIFIRILRAGATIVHDGACVVTHANTRVGEAYVHLHHGYGLGLGALVGKWLRLDFLFGVRVFWTLLRRSLARIARAKRGGRASPQDRALITGVFEGIREARAIPLLGERFVPAWSPDGLPTLRADGVSDE
ncbi:MULTISPECIES: glycosyltransferase family 2 protein [Microbacterium]|uniref:Glycosyltransferase n=1 Tax=Microbacterium marmarense TaxID=3122051 RepID=A0ABU8LPU1_9MICO